MATASNEESEARRSLKAAKGSKPFTVVVTPTNYMQALELEAIGYFRNLLKATSSPA